MSIASPEVGKAVEALMKTFPPKMVGDTVTEAMKAGADAAKKIPVIGGVMYLFLLTSPPLILMSTVKETTSAAAVETGKRVQEAVPKV